MKKVKDLFSTPKKAVLTILCALVLVAAVGAGVVYAYEAVAESAAIGEDNALNFACADAGVDPAAVQVVSIEFDREQGQFIYDVEFICGSVEYEYWIRATDGAVVKKESEELVSKTDAATKSTKAPETAKPTATPAASQTETAKPETPAAGSADIGLEAAKEKALADAGLSASQVTFTTTKKDYDDGAAIYEVEFYTGEKEYEYEIDATDGSIISRSVEARETAVSNNGANTPNTGSPIGIDEAKAIAAEHAGLSVNEVTFSKAKLENDDGSTVYEVEFYQGRTEYEYTIDAYSGTILEYDVDED